MSHPTNDPPWMGLVRVNAKKPMASHLDRFKGWALKIAKAEFDDPADVEWVYERLIEAYRCGKFDGQKVIVNGLRDMVAKHDVAGKTIFKTVKVNEVRDADSAEVQAEVARKWGPPTVTLEVKHGNVTGQEDKDA